MENIQLWVSSCEDIRLFIVDRADLFCRYVNARLPAAYSVYRKEPSVLKITFCHFTAWDENTIELSFPTFTYLIQLIISKMW